MPAEKNGLPSKCKMRASSRYVSDLNCDRCGRGEGDVCQEYEDLAKAERAAKQMANSKLSWPVKGANPEATGHNFQVQTPNGKWVLVTASSYAGALAKVQAEYQGGEATNGWQKGNVPTSEGWYRVMHPGDSENIDGFTIYEFGDYPGWAYWTPASADEFEDFEGGYKGGWSCEHDEEGESIFAFFGPITIPEFRP